MAALTTLFRKLLRKRSNPSGLGELVDVEELAQRLWEWLAKILPLRPDTVDTLRYKDAIQYFVTDRPSDPRVVRGAMLLQRNHGTCSFVQVFLDEHYDLVCAPAGQPYGRRIAIKQLDDELEATFKGKDLVIVE